MSTMGFSVLLVPLIILTVFLLPTSMTCCQGQPPAAHEVRFLREEKQQLQQESKFSTHRIRSLSSTSSNDSWCTTPTELCKTDRVTCSDNYQPVCGCDGKSYTNECIAIQKHCLKFIHAAGECKSEEQDKRTIRPAAATTQFEEASSCIRPESVCRAKQVRCSSYIDAMGTLIAMLALHCLYIATSTILQVGVINI